MSNTIESTIRLSDEASENLKKIASSLEEVKDKFQQIPKQTRPAAESTRLVEEAMGALAEQAMKFASIAAVTAFLKDVTSEAMEAQESVRHFQGQMAALGLDVELNKDKVKEWTASMQEFAHVEDDIVYEALGKSIKRTGDLRTSMQLVQLAQDIVITQGGDMASMLNMLSMAAGGTQRGVSMLNREFGQQLIGVKGAGEAINILQQHYGGAALKAESVSIKTSGATNSFKDLKKELGAELFPALTFVLDNAINPVIFGFLFLEKAVKSSATTMIAVGNLATNFLNNLIPFGNKLNAMTLAESWAVLRESIKMGGEELNKVWEDYNKKSKSALIPPSPIDVKAGQADLQETQEILTRKLEMTKATESLILSNKFATESIKIKAIEDAAKEEERITWSLGASKQQSYEETAEQVMLIEQNAQAQINQIRLQGTERWKVELHNYVTATMEMNNILTSISIRAFDSIGNAAGNAFARMLVDGEDFTKNFREAFHSLAISVLSDITAMILKMLVLRSVASLVGGPVMGFLPFAEGGRVTQPTYALLGDGGEPETVVPDSKRRQFALDVLRQEASSPMTQVSTNTGGVKSVSQGQPISVQVIVNAERSAGTLAEIAEAARSGTSEALEASLLMYRLAVANEHLAA